MIDKSIRQHYENGKEVDAYTAGKKTIWPVLKEQIKSQALPKEGRKLPNIIRTPLQRTALSKLGLGALNPILGLLSLFGIDPLGWAGRKLTEGGVKQAYQAGMTGFGSPAEGRELRQLEARRANMLRRKEEGKSYSQKNLDEVTNRINTIKKTAPVTVTDYEGEAYGTPDTIKDILDKQYEHEDKKTAPLRTTPIIDYESEAYGTETIADIQAKQKAEAERAMQETVRQAELQAEVTRQAEANAARIRAERARAAGPHGNGGGGHHGHTETRSSSGWESSPFRKGGPVRIPVTNVDRPLTGRRRDI